MHVIGNLLDPEGQEAHLLGGEVAASGGLGGDLVHGDQTEVGGYLVEESVVGYFVLLLSGKEDVFELQVAVVESVLLEVGEGLHQGL